MRFDCVVGETGEQGRHFRANLAQQHLPPSFASDRRGTAGRRRRERERETQRERVGDRERERGRGRLREKERESEGPYSGAHQTSFEAAGMYMCARSRCTHFTCSLSVQSTHVCHVQPYIPETSPTL